MIKVDGKSEKLASGLVKSFFSHLKTAEDQFARGGYSIILEPDPVANASWFTKGTMERSVFYVTTICLVFQCSYCCNLAYFVFKCQVCSICEYAGNLGKSEHHRV